MADQDQTTRRGESGGRSGLYIIVGLLVAAVVVLGFLYFNGNFGDSSDANVTVDPPATGDSPSTGDNPSKGDNPSSTDNPGNAK